MWYKWGADRVRGEGEGTGEGERPGGRRRDLGREDGEKEADRVWGRGVETTGGGGGPRLGAGRNEKRGRDGEEGREGERGEMRNIGRKGKKRNILLARREEGDKGQEGEGRDGRGSGLPPVNPLISDI